MQSPGGNRRIPLEGEVHGSDFSFNFDRNMVTGKMLSDTSMQVTFPGREESFQKGDMEKAMFCQLLGRVWDQGKTDLNRKNGAVWLPIDKAMDEFSAAINSYKKKASDPAKIETLYRAYLEKLMPADT